MRDYDYFVKKNIKMIYEIVKKEIGENKEPFRVSVDCLVRNEKDLKKASTGHAIRRRAKQYAKDEYKKAKITFMSYVSPGEDGARMGGVELKKGIPIPVMINGLTESNEITNSMVTSGIVEYLAMGKTENAELYKDLLAELLPEMLDVESINKVILLDDKYQKVFLDMVEKHSPGNFGIWDDAIRKSTGERINEQDNDSESSSGGQDCGNMREVRERKDLPVKLFDKMPKIPENGIGKEIEGIQGKSQC